MTVSWKEMTDQQRHIVFLEERVRALYDEAGRIGRTGELKEYADQVDSVAYDLEVYVDNLKRK